MQPPTIQSTPILYSPSLSARENIERQLFAIAKEHAEIAAHDIDRNDPEKTRIEMKHSIIAIVMSYIALEALSNDLYKRLTNKDFDSDDYQKGFKNSEPTSRWNYLARLAYQKQNNTNEKRSLSKGIIRDLDDLTEHRRQLIHYKPNPENLETLSRFPDNSPINPEFSLFTSEEATKAIETVRTLLTTFQEITGYEVPKLE